MSCDTGITGPEFAERPEVQALGDGFVRIGQNTCGTKMIFVNEVGDARLVLSNQSAPM
jgi:hypothetical protein